TPIPGVPGDFAEFPRDPALEGFDLSDRKFVAVARASRHSPTVLNAVDSDWRIYEEPLKRHGVEVEFLCPHLVSIEGGVRCGSYGRKPFSSSQKRFLHHG